MVTKKMWMLGRKILTKIGKPIANRPQVDNLPHTASVEKLQGHALPCPLP
jgi:hypothetical protein